MKLSRFYSILLLFSLFSITQKVNAQFVTIEDDAFAKLLCDSFPSVMSTDCKLLDTVKAKQITQAINGDGRGILNIKEIRYFNKTTALSFANNTITEIPDVSSFISLTLLNFTGNKIEGYIDFSKYKNLEYIILNNNLALMGISGLAQLTNLKGIQLINCNLNSFPSIEKLTEIKQLYLNNNHLSFADIMPLIENEEFEDALILFPQKAVPANDSIIETIEGKTITLHFDDDKAISGLTYTWYYNNVKIKSSIDNSMTKTNISISEGGNYFVSIKSNLEAFKNDSINSRLYIVKVSPKPIILPPQEPDPTEQKTCPLSFAFDIQHESYCDSITLVISILDLDTTQYSFLIENTFTHKRTKFMSKKEFSIKQGIYTITASNGNDCSINSNKSISFEYSDNCSKYFTPNADGIDDSWFIQDTGHVKIINSQYQIIKELDCPSEWDGTSTNNSLAPDGKYIILKSDGTKTAVSLFR